MITKLATFRGVSPAGEPLIHLFHPGEGLRKHAGTLQPPIQEWLDGYTAQPGKIAVLVNAMGASEYWGQNNNGDRFSEGALVHDCSQHPNIAHPYDEFASKVIPPYGYPTFLEALPFVHHRNKDPTRAFGKVAVSCYNPRMHRIELVVIIDEALAMLHGAQSVVDRIKAGEYPDVSMGTRVPYDVCFPAGTLVLSSTGWTPIEEVQTLDRVRTHEGRFRQVKHTNKRPYSGPMVSLRVVGMHKDLVQTANHPLLVVREEDLRSCHGSANGKRRRHTFEEGCLCKACGKDVQVTPMWTEADNVSEGDYLVYKRRRVDASSSIGAVRSYLLGLYLGDGHVIHQKTGRKKDGPRRNMGVGWTFEIDSPALYKFVNVCADWREDEDVNEPSFYSSGEGRNAQVANLYDQSLVEDFIRYGGEGCHGKKIAEEVFLWGKEDLLGLLGGLIDSDGSQDKTTGKIRIIGTNETLMMGAQRMCLDLGILASMDSYTSESGFGSRPTLVYQVGIPAAYSEILASYAAKVDPFMRRMKSDAVLTPEYALFRVGSAEHYEDALDVYNLQVEEDESYTVGQLAVHNCTICGKKARTRKEYCSCIKHIGMNKILEDGRQIGVDNPHPRFFDISFVFIGADKTAKMMCKLAAAQHVPLSVLEADEVYNIPLTDDGLIKAACAKRACTECRGGCKVAEVDRGLARTVRVARGAPSGVPPLIKTAAEWPDDPEAQQVIVKEMADRIRAAAKAHREELQKEGMVLLLPAPSPKALGIGAGVLGLGTLGVHGYYRYKKKKFQKERLAKRKAKFDSNQGYGPQSGDEVRDAIHRDLLKDNARLGRSMWEDVAKTEDEGAFQKRLREHPGVKKLEKAHGVKFTTFDTGPSEGTWKFNYEKRAAQAWKIGPPPMPNREQYPFVGTINFRGLKIGIENAPGTWRTGKGWKTLMKVPYGEFLHGKAGGVDGDKLDVYVGPSRNCQNVYIVHQNFVYGPKKGQYDEDKVMLGFDTPAQAKKTYLAHYDSPKFFRSITTMAFPLFKRAVMGGEVDGEKVAQSKCRKCGIVPKETENGVECGCGVKLAGLPYDDEGHGHIFPRSDGMKMRCCGPPKCSQCAADKERRDEMLKTAAKLEDLFSGAAKSERRKRTWKDKVTGEEETVSGSGINKQASAVRPEAIKLAKVLKHGYAPDDLLKVSNHPKTAAHLKWADILKEVGPSKAVGRVAPLLESAEPDLPSDLLDDMGTRPCLEESLATPAAMGMVLKPQEFQRMMLARMGRGGLANELDRAGMVFPSCEGHQPVCGSLMPRHVSGDIMDLLAPFLGERSYFGPVVRRRIIRIAVAKPRVSAPIELDTPLLTKVGQAYNWYRNEQLSMLTSPDRMKTASKVNPKTGLTPAGTALVLGSVPLALMYSVYQAHQKNKGKDLGVLDDFAAEHPWFASAGTGTALAAALRDPKIGKAIQDAFKKV